MNKNYFFLIFTLFLTPALQNGFAETYDINMPTGSASPDAPYYWQNEKTGEATGDIEILVGDTVVWKNGDQAKHTITSGTEEEGPDGIFGGIDFMVPGESYKFTFTEKGVYPYYCIVHPWMVGVVTVTEGFQIIADVGKDAGDGMTTFHIDYRYDGVISDATINEDQKSITFNIVSDANSSNRDLLMMLPTGLIEGPYAIYVDGVKDLRHDFIPGDEINTIQTELPEGAQQITIIGTKIVPEFGVIVLMILGVAFSSILITKKSRLAPRF